MTDPEIVYTRDATSGRVHKRVRVGEGLASLEACNLDDAGAFEILASIEDIEAADLCQRCFDLRD